MKKTYMNPSLEVVKIAAQQVLAGSITDAVTGTKFDSEAETETMDGRGFDFDED